MTIRQQLHDSKTHRAGLDPACPYCTLIGWKQHGKSIPTPDGINVGDYFSDGAYLGPDADGVEPEFQGGAIMQIKNSMKAVRNLGPEIAAERGRALRIAAKNEPVAEYMISGPVELRWGGAAVVEEEALSY